MPSILISLKSRLIRLHQVFCFIHSVGLACVLQILSVIKLKPRTWWVDGPEVVKELWDITVTAPCLTLMLVFFSHYRWFSLVQLVSTALGYHRDIIRQLVFACSATTSGRVSVFWGLQILSNLFVNLYRTICVCFTLEQLTTSSLGTIKYSHRTGVSNSTLQVPVSWSFSTCPCCKTPE